MKKYIVSALVSGVLVGCGGGSSSDGSSNGNEEVIYLDTGVVTANIDPDTRTYHGTPAVTFEEYANVETGIVEHNFDLEYGEFVSALPNHIEGDGYNTKITIPKGTYRDITYLDDAVHYIIYSGFFDIDKMGGTFNTTIPDTTIDLTVATDFNSWSDPYRKQADNPNQDYTNVLFNRSWINDNGSKYERVDFNQTKGSMVDGYGYKNVFYKTEMTHQLSTIYSEDDMQIDDYITESVSTTVVYGSSIQASVVYRVENSVTGKFDTCFIDYTEHSTTANGICYNDTNHHLPTWDQFNFSVDAATIPDIDETTDMRHNIREFFELESGYSFQDL